MHKKRSILGYESVFLQFNKFGLRTSSGLLKYSSRHLLRKRSTATVLDCPDSSQKRSSLSLTDVAIKLI